jgi:hypothetical protein
MVALKKAMILGITVFLIVWAALLSIGQVVGASEALPPTPTLVSPANNAWVTENKPTFKWFFNGNQSGFNLSISNQIDFATLVQNITSKSSTQNYTLTTALNDGMYYWRVRINDTSGVWSDWSVVWLVKVDTTPPTSVTVFSPRTWTELKMESLEIGGGEFVEINWTASNDPYFGQYELYISTNPAVLGTMNATIMGVKSTSYTLEVGKQGLKPGKTYYLSVVVVDQAGLSSEAAKTSVTTIAPMNWPLMGGVAIAVELVIGVIFVVFKLFIKKK